jgi:hypothetical protein
VTSATAGTLKKGDLIWYEQEIHRVRRVTSAGRRSRGSYLVTLELLDALQRRPKIHRETVNRTMPFPMATPADVARIANCCDGFLHEPCEVWDCPGCPTCGCHHSAWQPGGAGCLGLLRGAAAAARDGLVVEEDDARPFLMAVHLLDGADRLVDGDPAVGAQPGDGDEP